MLTSKSGPEPGDCVVGVADCADWLISGHYQSNATRDADKSEWG